MADVHTGSANKGGKMIVEAAQMLINCYPLERIAQPDCPRTKDGDVRKYSYNHHPCSKWVKESRNNFNWLLMHGFAMVNEKLYRGGKLHFCERVFRWCHRNPPDLPTAGFTFPALAMPEQYKSNDYVQSYRDYYVYNKMANLNLNWTRRDKPYWTTV